MEKVKYYVDIDNTICKTIETRYEFAKPIYENIKKINDLYDQGHEITYYTARGVTFGIDFRDVTERQLKMWNCKYHFLKMTKPAFDYIIDDKAKRIEEL
jgi:hypothetical protein